MAAINFPTPTAIGQTFTPPGGPTYTWDGMAWIMAGGEPAPIDFPVDSVNGKTGDVVLTAADVGAVNISGDTMTGPLALPALNSLKLNGVPVLSGPCVYAVKQGVQPVSYNTYTKATLEYIGVDTNGCFVNGRFTPNVPGYYLVIGTLGGGGSVNTYLTEAMIVKNGQTSNSGSFVYDPNAYATSVSNVQAVVSCNGTTDYIELHGRVAGTGDNSFSNANLFSFYMRGL
jgi:hypothetical protein